MILDGRSWEVLWHFVVVVAQRRWFFELPGKALTPTELPAMEAGLLKGKHAVSKVSCWCDVFLSRKIPLNDMYFIMYIYIYIYVCISYIRCLTCVFLLLVWVFEYSWMPVVQLQNTSLVMGCWYVLPAASTILRQWRVLLPLGSAEWHNDGDESQWHLPFHPGRRSGTRKWCPVGSDPCYRWPGYGRDVWNETFNKLNSVNATAKMYESFSYQNQ